MSRKILIIRKSSLGDLVHTIPAFNALRAAHADAEIHWAVTKAGVPLLQRVKRIDAIREFSGSFLRGLRSEQFDVTIDFQGLLKTAAASWLAGGRRIGFARGHTREWGCQIFYTDAVVPRGAHVIEKNLSLAEHAGASPATGAFSFGELVTDEERERIDQELLRLDVAPGFVLINPGAAWANKRWSPRKFGEVASRLAGRQVLVSYGPGERGIAEEVVASSAGAAMLAFPTSFLEFGALAARSSLLITGDTGPMHLASAIGARVLGLFAPTNPYRNGPWNDADRWIVADTRCDFCYRRACPWENCIDSITIDRVADLAREMLG
ncbi:MAG: glycosyltransferase family 9 protein [Acidobacteria bacterium]|nr:glycosyltransferase family 9 protein [Acidobacteriota bacterium]